MIDAHLLEAIGDAPDHIAALRKLAVAFAIGGHLDHDDTVSATELLASLEAVKNTLRRQGQIGKKKSDWTVLPEHLPEVFDDPTKFVPLGEIARIEKGKTGIKQAVPGIYPLVVTAATRETCDHFDFEGAAAIIPLVSSTGHGNASINRLHYQEGQFALGTILAAVFPHDPDSTSARFLFEYLSAYKDELLVSRMTGTANVTLSIGRIAEVPVPLLSPNAQAKVDELMALCDRLEEARKTREETRDKLTVASLARLTAPDITPEDFPAHARFALEALPALTKRPDQIKTLRQTILNLAVRGKLVEQDPAEESASSSLAKIAEARDADASRKSKRARGLPPVSDTEASELPTGWESVRLSDIAISMRYGTSTKCGPDNSLVPVLRIPNVSSGQVTLDDMKYGPLDEREQADLALVPGDLLMIRSNGSLDIVGRSAVVPTEASGMAFAGYLVRLRTAIEQVNTTYVWIAMNSQLIRDQIEKPIRSAVGLKNVNLTEFGNLSFWLPPLAEQHRIVAKVDALMALCDRLEAALTTADTTRTRLLEALLHEALEPSANALAAAE